MSRVGHKLLISFVCMYIQINGAQLTHMTHIQFAVHQSNTLLESQCRPSQARKKKSGGSPNAGTGPIVTPSSTKQNAPKLFRIHRWMKLNLLKASFGARGGFCEWHRFTTGDWEVLCSMCSSILYGLHKSGHKVLIGRAKFLEKRTWKVWRCYWQRQ